MLQRRVSVRVRGGAPSSRSRCSAAAQWPAPAGCTAHAAPRPLQAPPLPPCAALRRLPWLQHISRIRMWAVGHVGSFVLAVMLTSNEVQPLACLQVCRQPLVLPNCSLQRGQLALQQGHWRAAKQLPSQQQASSGRLLAGCARVLGMLMCGECALPAVQRSCFAAPQPSADPRLASAPAAALLPPRRAAAAPPQAGAPTP